MHIGWAMVFDPLPDGGTPSLDALRARTDERLDLLPRFRLRLSTPRVGSLSLPHWEPDPEFDVANHMRRATLPAPGGEAELLEWLGDFYSHRLDRHRPLWETTLLDGLEGGRWALVTNDVVPTGGLNQDIEHGGYRAIDIRQAPFSRNSAVIAEYAVFDGYTNFLKHVHLLPGRRA